MRNRKCTVCGEKVEEVRMHVSHINIWPSLQGRTIAIPVVGEHPDEEVDEALHEAVDARVAASR